MESTYDDDITLDDIEFEDGELDLPDDASADVSFVRFEEPDNDDDLYLSLDDELDSIEFEAD